MEAGTDADLTNWLDKNTLLTLWPELFKSRESSSDLPDLPYESMVKV